MSARITCLVLAAAYLGGCTTMNRIDPPAAGLASTLRTGDHVALAMRNGKTREFTVSRLTPEEVCGPGDCVRVDEIDAVERQEFSGTRTALLVLAILALILIAGIAASPPAMA